MTETNFYESLATENFFKTVVFKKALEIKYEKWGVNTAVFQAQAKSPTMKRAGECKEDILQSLTSVERD